jgi:hypothetical protein
MDSCILPRVGVSCGATDTVYQICLHLVRQSVSVHPGDGLDTTTASAPATAVRHSNDEYGGGYPSIAAYCQESPSVVG